MLALIVLYDTFIARVASVLKSTLIGDLQQWTSAEMTWRRLQGVVADKEKESEAEEQRTMEENGGEFQIMKKRRKMDCGDEYVDTGGDFIAGKHGNYNCLIVLLCLFLAYCAPKMFMGQPLPV